MEKPQDITAPSLGADDQDDKHHLFTESLMQCLREPNKSPAQIEIIRQHTASVIYFKRYYTNKNSSPSTTSSIPLEQHHLSCCAHLTYQFTPKGNHVYRMDDPSDKFYIVLSGAVDIYAPPRRDSASTKVSSIQTDAQQLDGGGGGDEEKKNNNEGDENSNNNNESNPNNSSNTNSSYHPFHSTVHLQCLRAGTWFGDDGILCDRARITNAHCSEDTHLAVLPKAVFLVNLKASEEQRMKQSIAFLRSLACFNGWTVHLLREMHFHLPTRIYKYKDYVFEDTDPSDFAGIIVSGNFAIFKSFVVQQPIPSTSAASKQQNSSNTDAISSFLDSPFNRNECAFWTKTQEKKVLDLSEKELFGEDDLIQKQPRRFSVKCESVDGGEVLLINENVFKEFVLKALLVERTIVSRISLKQTVLNQRIAAIASNFQQYKHLLRENRAELKLEMLTSSKKQPIVPSQIVGATTPLPSLSIQRANSITYDDEYNVPDSTLSSRKNKDATAAKELSPTNERNDSGSPKIPQITTPRLPTFELPIKLRKSAAGADESYATEIPNISNWDVSHNSPNYHNEIPFDNDPSNNTVMFMVDPQNQQEITRQVRKQLQQHNEFTNYLGTDRQATHQIRKIYSILKNAGYYEDSQRQSSGLSKKKYQQLPFRKNQPTKQQDQQWQQVQLQQFQQQIQPQNRYKSNRVPPVLASNNLSVTAAPHRRSRQVSCQQVELSTQELLLPPPESFRSGRNSVTAATVSMHRQNSSRNEEPSANGSRDNRQRFGFENQNSRHRFLSTQMQSSHGSQQNKQLLQQDHHDNYHQSSGFESGALSSARGSTKNSVHLQEHLHPLRYSQFSPRLWQPSSSRATNRRLSPLELDEDNIAARIDEMESKRRDIIAYSKRHLASIQKTVHLKNLINSKTVSTAVAPQKS